MRGWVLGSHFLEACAAGVSSFTGKGDGGLHSHPALLGGGKCVNSPAPSLPPETAQGAVTNELGEGGSRAPGGSGDSQEAQQGLKAA